MTYEEFHKKVDELEDKGYYIKRHCSFMHYSYVDIIGVARVKFNRKTGEITYNKDDAKGLFEL